MTVVPKRAYTLEFKLGVVEWVESSQQSYRSAARQFGLDRKIIRTWVSQKASLLSALTTLGPQRKKIRRGKSLISERMDQQVLEFQLQSRRCGARVLDRDLQAKALECAQQLGLANFKASGVWLKGWKQRNGVVYQNGSNEVALPQFSVLASPQSSSEPRGSRLLSHTKSCDHIRMPRKAKPKKNSQCSCRTDSSPPVLPTDSSLPALPSPVPGPVHMDYTSQEHSYSQPPGLSEVAEVSTGSAAMDPTVGSAVDPSGSCSSSPGIMRDHTDFVLPTTHFGPAHLGSTQLSPTQLSPTYLGSFPEPSLFNPDPDSDRSDSTLFDPLGMVGEVSELELPLGHEEVVGEEVWLNGKSPSKKSRKGRGKGRGKGGLKRSPTPVATFCYLDDPQGLGGLLASRLSQPVFQTGPEIVYMDTTAAFPTIH